MNSLMPRALTTATMRRWRSGFVVALVSAGLLACAGTPQIAPAVQPGSDGEYPSPIADWRGSAAEILAGAIRLKTVNPPGDEALLAKWLSRVLEQEDGIESRVVSLEGANSRRAALWARVPGNGSKPPLVLLSHLDTVPADADAWTVDPFAGIVGGGFVVGRGALDAKGVTIVHLLTLVALARRDAPLDRDIILLATPDEEAGGLHGAARVARDRLDLLGGAEYLLTEGGGIQPSVAGQPDLWGVAFTEKTPCWLDVTARGLPGHGSTGGQHAAPARLAEALARLAHLDAPIQVVPSVALMFEALAPLAAEDVRSHFAQLRGALALHPEFRERFLSDPGRAALVRNTAVVTTLRAGESVNMVPASAHASIDARLLPGESCIAFTEQVRRTVGAEVEVEIRLAFDAAESPIDTALMGAIKRVAARQEPPGVALPRVIAGFTDAHWFRGLGITSYGFVPRRLRPIETRGIHGPNERISLDNLTLGVETLVEILEELDAQP